MEKRTPFDFECDLRTSLGGRKEIVQLRANDSRQCEIFVPLCQGDHVIRLRIKTEKSRLEILKKSRVAQFVDIDRAVDLVGQIDLRLKRDPVTARSDWLAGQ